MYAAMRRAAALEFGAGESRRANPREYVDVFDAFTISYTIHRHTRAYIVRRRIIFILSHKVIVWLGPPGSALSSMNGPAIKFISHRYALVILQRVPFNHLAQ